jgi:hypothetical protein
VVMIYGKELMETGKGFAPDRVLLIFIYYNFRVMFFCTLRTDTMTDIGQ